MSILGRINWETVETGVVTALIIALLAGLWRRSRQLLTADRLLAVTRHPKYRLVRNIILELVVLFYLFNCVFMAPRSRPGLNRGIYVGCAVGILATRLTTALIDVALFSAIGTMLAATPQVLVNQEEAKKQHRRAMWSCLWQIWSSAIVVAIALGTY